MEATGLSPRIVAGKTGLLREERGGDIMSTRESQVEDWGTTMDNRGQHWKQRGDHVKRKGRTGGYIAAIVVNFVILYVFNNLLSWQVPFLTQDWVAPLAFFNVAIVATIGANIVFLAYDSPWFRHLVQAGLSVLGFLAVYMVWAVFPFDFPAEIWNLLGHIVLALIMVGLGIGIVVDVVKVVIGRD